MARYVLYVHVRRGGVTQDSSEHDAIEADSDQTAIRKLVGSAYLLKSHYDEVYCEIRCGDRLVHKFSA